MTQDLICLSGAGLFLVVYGILTIIHKRAVVSFGHSPRGLRLVMLGIPALIVGITGTFGGILMVFPILRAGIFNRLVIDDMTLRMWGVIGGFIAIIGSFIATGLQASINIIQIIVKRFQQRP